MGRIIADLGNENNWESLWNTNLEGVPSGTDRYYPIPETTCPLLIDKHILAVATNSNKSSPSWKSAGFLNYKIRTGLVVGGIPNTQIGKGFRLKLNQITLLILPRYSETFSISFGIHYWIQQISIDVFQYIGALNDSTELMIEGIRNNELARIEQKIDENYGL
jgi:hypothetical protein